ncbi:MAG: putative HNH endonuclease [uncultured marine phage]|uniref:Putative HNH endonuclease n=1 Tax=uncultured marine phage TaxID=707152 RepID=A0A8D9C8H0_9VIRU|nr:MAG: putative HNH endonuclease [uncultured marine phage]
MNTLKTKLYDNCSVYSPCGKLMFRCKEKRINWYLDRNLAKLIDVPGEDGICAQLLFEPKGLGKHEDLFSLEKAENKCVVCGTDEDLTRHHVVPTMYRKHFPEIYKSNYHHDVLPICRTCHDRYELTADILKEELNEEYGSKVDYKEMIRISRIAYDYYHYRDVMDDEKVVNCVMKLTKFDDNPLDKLEKLISLKEVGIDGLRNQGKDIIDNHGSLQDFVEMWRSHFVKKSNPKHLSKHWSIKRSLKKDN